VTNCICVDYFERIFLASAGGAEGITQHIKWNYSWDTVKPKASCNVRCDASQSASNGRDRRTGQNEQTESTN
jgi:hypothetical protein